MPDAMPQDWPPNDALIVSWGQPRIFKSSLNGAEQVLRSPSWQWLLTYNYRDLDDMDGDAAAIIAFGNAHFSTQDIFTVYSEKRPTPLGTCKLQSGGTQTVTAISGRTVTINGWDTGLTGNLFEPGDLIEIDNAKEVLEVRTAVPAGTASVNVPVSQYPRLTALYVDSVVSFIQVPFYVRLSKPIEDRVTPPLLSAFSVEMREALDAAS